MLPCWLKTQKAKESLTTLWAQRTIGCHLSQQAPNMHMQLIIWNLLYNSSYLQSYNVLLGHLMSSYSNTKLSM